MHSRIIFITLLLLPTCCYSAGSSSSSSASTAQPGTSTSSLTSSSSSSLSSLYNLTPEEFAARAQHQRAAQETKKKYDLQEEARQQAALEREGKEQKQQAFEEQEEKKQEAQESVVLQSLTTPKIASSVPSLMELTAQSLVATIDQKRLESRVAELVHLWTHPSHDKDFNALLKESEQIIHTLYPELSGNMLHGEIANIIYQPIAPLLMHNETTGTLISSLPLFTTIGTWPSEIQDVPVFNKQGIFSVIASDAIYVFNCATRTMLTIDDNNNDEDSSLHYSYDGRALIKHEPNLKNPLEGALSIFDIKSGKLIHSVNPIRDYTISQKLPLCVYVGGDGDVTTRYDYTTNTSTQYPLIIEDPGNAVIQKASPQGNFSLYMVEENNGSALYDHFIQNNVTSQSYLLKKQLTDLDGIEDALSNFNQSETMFTAMSWRGYYLKIFKLNELVPGRSEQKPYIELDNYNTFSYASRSWLPSFSPDETQILIPEEAGFYILDLSTKERLETFSPGEIAKFYLQNSILLTSQTSKESTLYIRDTKTRIPLGRLKTLSTTAMKAVTQLLTHDSIFTYIFNIKQNQKCYIPTPPLLKDYSYKFDTHGTLFYADNNVIQQLIIDPTECTLYQLFFLLGIAHAERDRATKKVYTQLLESPTLATFSPAVRDHLAGIIKGHLKSKIDKKHKRTGVISKSKRKKAKN